MTVVRSPCPMCKGHKYDSIEQAANPKVHYSREKVCPRCEGNGYITSLYFEEFVNGIF
jgi:hypothetical protein